MLAERHGHTMKLHVFLPQFLTQEEFRKIRLKQLAAELEPRKGKRRQIVELEDGQTPGSVGGGASVGELLSEDAINLVHKRRKLDKNERVDAVKVRRWWGGSSGVS